MVATQKNYEVKGNKSRAVILFVLAAVMLVCAVFLFQLRGSKTTVIGGSSSTQRDELGRLVTSIGHREVDTFSDEAKTLLAAVAAAALIAAALTVDAGIAMLRCGLKLCGDHVEGRAYGLGAAKRFSLLRSNVQSVEQSKGGVEISAGGQKYRVMCDNAAETFARLREWQSAQGADR